jgi:hypothetical protein
LEVMKEVNEIEQPTEWNSFLRNINTQ